LSVKQGTLQNLERYIKFDYLNTAKHIQRVG